MTKLILSPYIVILNLEFLMALVIRNYYMKDLRQQIWH